MICIINVGIFDLVEANSQNQSGIDIPDHPDNKTWVYSPLFQMLD